MSEFRAILVSKEGEKGQKAELTTLSDADLMDGDVSVRVTHSTVNYKDGLALTGKAPIIRRWPLVPGIDFAGEVETSEHPDFKPGDRVILNGWGVGEGHHGGYAQKARVNGDWLIHCPDALTNAEAMAIGTAGYTAALCVLALMDHNASPSNGPALVTGAAGGVGSTAIVLLAKLGFHVMASTGRSSEADYLTSLGAPPRSSTGPNCPNPAARSARSVGPARWIRWEATRLPTCWRKRNTAAMSPPCGLAQGMDLPGHGRALHPARRFLARHRFGARAQGPPIPRLRVADPAPGQGRDCPDHHHDRP